MSATSSTLAERPVSGDISKRKDHIAKALENLRQRQASRPRAGAQREQTLGPSVAGHDEIRLADRPSSLARSRLTENEPRTTPLPEPWTKVLPSSQRSSLSRRLRATPVHKEPPCSAEPLSAVFCATTRSSTSCKQHATRAHMEASLGSEPLFAVSRDIACSTSRSDPHAAGAPAEPRFGAETLSAGFRASPNSSRDGKPRATQAYPELSSGSKEFSAVFHAPSHSSLNCKPGTTPTNAERLSSSEPLSTISRAPVRSSPRTKPDWILARADPLSSREPLSAVFCEPLRSSGSSARGTPHSVSEPIQAVVPKSAHSETGPDSASTRNPQRDRPTAALGEHPEAPLVHHLSEASSSSQLVTHRDVRLASPTTSLVAPEAMAVTLLEPGRAEWTDDLVPKGAEADISYMTHLNRQYSGELRCLVSEGARADADSAKHSLEDVATEPVTAMQDRISETSLAADDAATPREERQGIRDAHRRDDKEDDGSENQKTYGSFKLRSEPDAQVTLARIIHQHDTALQTVFTPHACVQEHVSLMTDVQKDANKPVVSGKNSEVACAENRLKAAWLEEQKTMLAHSNHNRQLKKQRKNQQEQSDHANKKLEKNFGEREAIWKKSEAELRQARAEKEQILQELTKLRMAFSLPLEMPISHITTSLGARFARLEMREAEDACTRKRLHQEVNLQKNKALQAREQEDAKVTALNEIREHANCMHLECQRLQAQLEAPSLNTASELHELKMKLAVRERQRGDADARIGMFEELSETTNTELRAEEKIPEEALKMATNLLDTERKVHEDSMESMTRKLTVDRLTHEKSLKVAEARLEAERETHKESLDSINVQLEAAQRLHEESVDKAAARFSAERDTINAAWQEDRNMLEQLLQEAQNAADEAERKTKLLVESNAATLEAERKTHAESLKTTIESAIVAERRTHEESLEVAIHTAVEAERRTHKDSLEAAINSAVEAERRTHKDSLEAAINSALEAERRTHKESLETAINSSLEAERRTYEKSLETAITSAVEVERRLHRESLDKAINSAVESSETVVNATLEAERRAHQKSMELVNARSEVERRTHSELLESVNIAHQESLETAIHAKFEAERCAPKESLKSINAAHEESLEAAINVKLEMERRNHQESLELVNAKLEKEREKHQKSIESITAAHEESLEAAIHAKLDVKTRAHEESLKLVNATLEAERRTHKQLLESINVVHGKSREAAVNTTLEMERKTYQEAMEFANAMLEEERKKYHASLQSANTAHELSLEAAIHAKLEAESKTHKELMESTNAAHDESLDTGMHAKLEMETREHKESLELVKATLEAERRKHKELSESMNDALEEARETAINTKLEMKKIKYQESLESVSAMLEAERKIHGKSMESMNPMLITKQCSEATRQAEFDKARSELEDFRQKFAASTSWLSSVSPTKDGLLAINKAPRTTSTLTFPSAPRTNGENTRVLCAAPVANSYPRSTNDQRADATTPRTAFDTENQNLAYDEDDNQVLPVEVQIGGSRDEEDGHVNGAAAGTENEEGGNPVQRLHEMKSLRTHSQHLRECHKEPTSNGHDTLKLQEGQDPHFPSTVRSVDCENQNVLQAALGREVRALREENRIVRLSWASAVEERRRLEQNLRQEIRRLSCGDNKRTEGELGPGGPLSDAQLQERLDQVVSEAHGFLMQQQILLEEVTAERDALRKALLDAAESGDTEEASPHQGSIFD